MSVTRTIPSKYGTNKTVRPHRVFDYLYDPVYTVSSEVDHVRASLKAYASKDRVRKVPEYGSMFSNLVHIPHYTVRLDATDPVPPTIDRRWRGHTDQCKEALQQLVGVAPNVASWVRKEEHHVTGADRWRYFKRPLISTDMIFPFPIEESVFTESKNAEQKPTHCTVAVQTDFRESEAQTDPYSPEYVIQPGTSPSELLALAALTWGRGLPAGQAEVEMIEWMRVKRAWEASLPPLDDLNLLARRRRMMEEMEAKEWALREGEIQRLQEARLAVLTDLLKQRDETHKEATHERLNQTRSKRQKDVDTKLHRIHNEYMRSLRKLEAKRRNAEVKLKYQQIRSSPRTRSFVTNREIYTGRNVASTKMKTYYFDTYEGLLELEGGLFSSALEPQVKPPASKVTKDGIKPSDRDIQLMEQYRTLSEEAQGKKKPLKALIKKEKTVPHPVTPTVEEPPEGDEERDVAVIYLQKLLRGRSVQHKMFIGKENHLETIMELRTVHALHTEEQDLQTTEKNFITALKRQGDKNRHEATQQEASQSKAVGAELENLFDTLSKELIRLQQERRMHAFMLLAERNRRLREAEESGKRQVEEQRHREEDEIFRQVVQIHQETVDLYLEDIILGTVEQTADQQARQEIHRMAKEVNDIAYAMEDSCNSLQSEELISELVYSFLIPETEKINVRAKVQQKQRRHWQAAGRVIQGIAEHSGNSPSS